MSTDVLFKSVIVDSIRPNVPHRKHPCTLNRPVHTTSYILAILRDPSVTMLQPINLWALSYVGELLPIMHGWTDLKWVGKVAANSDGTGL